MDQGTRSESFNYDARQFTDLPRTTAPDAKPSAYRLLIVAGETRAAQLGKILRPLGWQLHIAQSPESAAALANQAEPLVGLFDFSTFTLERWATARQELLASNVEWIALASTESLDCDQMRRVLADDFFDYHTLPLDASVLRIILGHALGMSGLRTRRRHEARTERLPFCGSTATMRRLQADLAKAARSDAPVLIAGETGTGKELTAKTLHQQSARAGAPFVVVDCSSLSPNLVHSELFGHERGAFTGADRMRIGRIESAQGGTLFLDEIGDLPLDQQVNLLRFLQEGTIQRLGAAQPMAVDARIVAATHVRLDEAVQAGTFREDLYYRLNVITLELAPLRERIADVDELARVFFEEFRLHQPTTARGLSQEAMNALRSHDWPGNVRELRNRLQRAMIMTDNRLLTGADLALTPAEFEPGGSLREARLRAEREAIELALNSCRGNRTQAARRLGVSRITLYRLMDKYELVSPATNEQPEADT